MNNSALRDATAHNQNVGLHARTIRYLKLTGT